MWYTIILMTDYGMEMRLDIPRLPHMDFRNDKRILDHYVVGQKVTVTINDVTETGTVISVYKLYPHSRVEKMKRKETA